MFLVGLASTTLLALQSSATATEVRPLFAPELPVLHEFVGEAAGDQFGWIGRNAGDCDGDGVNDVLLSAPTSNAAAPLAGRVYVYSGKSGKLLWQRDGLGGSQLGLGIERAGDVNRDGHADVIAGAPGARGGRGEALVLSGKDGAPLLTLAGESRGDTFGRKVGECGDANGDGHSDLLVGADQCDSVDVDAGRAYLFSGKDGSALLTLDGERKNDKFGVSLCGVTRDKSAWILVGAADAGDANGGRAYMFEWKGQGEAELVYTIEADETGVGLGRMFVSFVGDVDADGFPDAYVSDWENNALGPSTGRVYVHSGRSGERLHVLTGERAGDGFGIGTADVGDVDRDGHADLLIGAWQSREAAPSGGKCYLYSGKSGALLQAWACTVANETFGFDTTGMGDVDGDGTLDYLVTNAWSGIAGARSGRAFLLSGRR
jgi:hypothetical protein